MRKTDKYWICYIDNKVVCSFKVVHPRTSIKITTALQ